MKRSCSQYILSLLLIALLGGCGGLEAGSTEDTALPPEETPVPVVTLFEREYAPDTRSLTLAGSAVTEEDIRAAIAALPELETLEYPECALTAEEQLSLREDFPGVRFLWPVRWDGQTFPCDAETLDLSGAGVSAEELRRMLPLFPQLTEAALGSARLNAEEITELRSLFPGVLFRYETELFGQTFVSTAEEIDLSGIPMEDTAELEAALVHFPKLRKVLLCDCGLDNETMDALNHRHEGIEFVWYVQVFCNEIRSDTTYYTMYNAERYVTPGVGIENLRYCHDMEALDLGHSGASSEDIRFLSEMPHLKYLILAECHIDDISVVGELRELTYLEIFVTPCRDLSPLLNCPLLTDLNISYCGALTPDCVDVLKQMTQLERLWFYGQTAGARLNELLESLPDCHIEYARGPESTDGGWREHEHYYAMRDALHMHYMK